MANMANQMELFDEGGLMDEGGTVDPVSGNDVPVGSTQEEVRDDIPAQLSEGEFVFPADVVRFIGLEKLMNIRQRAKAGLQRMDDMGQMGNSEEATIPDDLPFSLDDLDMEDDGLEMAQGGVVHMANGGQAPIGINPPGPPYQNPPISGAVPMPGFTGISGYTPPAPVTTGFAPAPVVQQPVAAASSAQQTQAGTLPGTQFIPTTVQQALPTFQGTVGMGVSGVDYEEVEYVNDAGQIIKLKKNKATGELLEPVPEGFKLKTDAIDKTATVSPTTGVDRATVTDDGDGGGDEGPPTGATVSFGGTAATGNRAGLVDGAFRGNLSIETPGAGFLGGLGAAKSYMGKGAKSLAYSLTGGKIGEQLTLEPGHRAVISDIIVPGSRTTPLGRDKTLALDLVLDAKAYNSLMTGKVSSRQEMAKVAQFVDKYGENIVGADEGRVHVNDALRSVIQQVEEEEKRGNVTSAGRFKNQFEAVRAAQNRSKLAADTGRPDDSPTVEDPTVTSPTAGRPSGRPDDAGVGRTPSEIDAGAGRSTDTGAGRTQAEIDAGAGVSRSDDPFSMDYSGPPGSEDNMGIGEDGPDRGPVNQQTLGDSLFEGTGTQGDSPSSDPCFITTAIVEKKGEADDGETLTKLRKFRNEYMADKQEEVQEYYEIAPKIVEAIDNDEEWKWIEGQIQKAVDYIDEEKHDDAYTTYKSMVSTLKEKWLV